MAENQQQVTPEGDSAETLGAYRVEHTHKTDVADDRSESGIDQPISDDTSDSSNLTAPEVALCGLAPRQMRKQINLGCGQAACAGRTVVTATDLPEDASQTRQIGF